MIIDILFVLMIFLCIVVGLKRGFAMSLFGFVSTFLSIIIAYLLYNPYKDFIMKFSVYYSIRDFFAETIGKNFKTTLSSSYDFPSFIPKSIIEDNLTGIASDAAIMISNIIMTVLAFILFILLIKFAMKFIEKFINNLVRLPIIKQFDKILGGIMGVVNGVLLCYFTAAVLFFIVVTWGNTWIVSQLDSSYTQKFFYDNNFIINTFMKFND